MSLSGEYDSNVNGTATGESSDLIGRVSFGFGLAYQSPRVGFSLNYGTSAEWYRDETELDNFGDEQNAGVGLTWIIDPRTTVTLSASYSRTNDSNSFIQPVVIAAPPPVGTPSAAGPAPSPPTSAAPPTGLPDTSTVAVPGVDAGRRLSEVFGATASLTYQINPLTTGSASYAYTRTHVEGDPESQGHSVSLALGRTLTQVDGISLTYQFQYFDSEVEQSETFHNVLLGWSRQLGPVTTMSLQAGPSISGETGEVDLAANASLSHGLGWGTVSLGYSRAQSLVLGLTGARTTDMFTAALGSRPTRDLNLSFVLSASRIEEGGTSGDTWTYAATASASYAITDWLAARLTYQFTYEDSDPRAIDRHVVSLSLDLSYPFRLDR